MKVDLYNITGEKSGSVEIADAIFAKQWNADLVHQAVTAQMANKRLPWAHAKGRGEVRGGGKKPWKQKGTGRARHGSIRSPIWKGGGASHGPVKTRDFSQKLNKKMARAALHSTLSRKLVDGDLKFIDKIPATGKTKEMFSSLRGFLKVKSGLPSTVIIYSSKDGLVLRSARNITKVKILSGSSLNIVDILNAKNILVDQAAIAEIK